jgi:hypothetical protein
LRTFLDLWKDVDPGIVEVKNAKKRLVGLKNRISKPTFTRP